MRTISGLYSILLVCLLTTLSAISEDFSSNTLPNGWRVAVGSWKVADGVLVGSEQPADHHPSVLLIPDPHVSSKVHFRLRFDGASAFSLSYNHSKGHLARLIITKGQAILQMDKDKTDSESQPKILAKSAFTPKPGEWVDLVSTIEGTQFTVNLGDITLTGSNPNLAKEKTGYRLVVSGQSVAVDDLAFESQK